MLAELAMANAAFRVIQESLAHGKELFEMGEHLATFSDAGRAIDQKAKLARKGSEQESDLEYEGDLDIEFSYAYTQTDIFRTIINALPDQAPNCP